MRFELVESEFVSRLMSPKTVDAPCFICDLAANDRCLRCGRYFASLTKRSAFVTRPKHKPDSDENDTDSGGSEVSVKTPSSGAAGGCPEALLIDDLEPNNWREAQRAALAEIRSAKRPPPTKSLADMTFAEALRSPQLARRVLNPMRKRPKRKSRRTKKLEAACS